MKNWNWKTTQSNETGIRPIPAGCTVSAYRLVESYQGRPTSDLLIHDREQAIRALRTAEERNQGVEGVLVQLHQCEEWPIAGGLCTEPKWRIAATADCRSKSEREFDSMFGR